MENAMLLSFSSIPGFGVGRLRAVVRTATIGAALAFAAASVAQAHEGAVIVNSSDENGVVHALAAPVTPAKGWQGPIDYTVPVGKDVIFSYECPSGLPIPISGSFNAN